MHYQREKTPKKILISAGEASGDLYGAKLVADLKKQKQDIKFYGLGGKLMRQAGVTLLMHFKDLAIIGITDLPFRLKKIYVAFKRMKRAILQNHLDLIILIDFPDFNLRLAKIAKKAGIKTLYYVSPQIWAWRKSRTKLLKRYVDHMAVILPFEIELYQKAEIPVTFVGHPLLDIVKPNMRVEETKKKFELNTTSKIIGFMPGSRIEEIKHLLPTMIKATELLKNRYEDMQIILPLAPSLEEKRLFTFMQKTELKIHIVKGHNYDAMRICDAMIVASGTATLEVALSGVPMLIVYKLSTFNYLLCKILVKTPYIGLCNLIADKKAVAEFIQWQATPSTIAAELDKILSDKNYRDEIIADLSLVRQILTVKTEMNIAQLTTKMLTE